MDITSSPEFLEASDDLVDSMEELPKNFVPVFDAQNNIEAELVKSFLDNHQIDSFIRGNTHRSMLGMLGTYIELEILVPEAKAAEAKDLIKRRMQEYLADESQEGFPVEDRDSVHAGVRREGPLFSIFLPLLLPGMSNANAGNRRLGVLFGVLSTTFVIAATLTFSSQWTTPSLTFFGLSFLSMGALDIVTAWLYRQKPTRQYSQVLWFVVLIVLVLWLPTLWLIVEGQ